MKPNYLTVERLVLVALTVLIVTTLVQVPRATQAAPLSAGGGQMLGVQMFDVNCKSLASVTQTYAKLDDLGTFTVNSVDSVVEMTFNGRVFVNGFTSGTGAVFELRVDGVPSPVGRARANIRTAEAGGPGVPVSITGLFTGLTAGDHTASMWVRTSIGGAGSSAMVDPGCWSTDILIVKEYLPFGVAFLPAVISSE